MAFVFDNEKNLSRVYDKKRGIEFSPGPYDSPVDSRKYFMHKIDDPKAPLGGAIEVLKTYRDLTKAESENFPDKNGSFVLLEVVGVWSVYDEWNERRLGFEIEGFEQYTKEILLEAMKCAVRRNGRGHLKDCLFGVKVGSKDKIEIFEE